MKPDPVRWRDGAADAPQDARAWLEGLRAPGPMPSASRARAAAVASRAVGAKAGAAWWSAKVLLAVGALGVATLSARAAFIAPVRAVAHAPRTATTIPRAHTLPIVVATRIVAPATPSRTNPVVNPPTSSPAGVPHRAHSAVAPVAAVTTPGAPTASMAVATSRADDTPALAAAPPESTLAREVRQVDALRALVASDPAAALAAADAMAREFPDGTTAPDREFYAFEALRRLGRSDEARARGEHLVARFAGTPGAVRVARALARDE